MRISVGNGIIAAIGFTGLVAGSLLAQSPGRLAPSSMPQVGKVDDRFQSYNVEMVEVTGGRFWAPYKKGAAASAAPATPAPRSSQTVLPQSLSAATANGDVPAIAGVRGPSGVLALPPASISFFAIPQANNAACTAK